MTDYKEVRTTEHVDGHEQRVATFKFTQLIWLLVGLLESTIALRFVFKLIGVNAANSFASLLYNVTDLFVAPFASLIRAPAAGGRVMEISSLIAIFVYVMIGWALERIVYVLFYRPSSPVSVRQTIIADQPLQPVPLSVSETTVTESTVVHTPVSP